MAPGLTAHEHLSTGVTVLGHAVTLVPMGLERFAQQGVLGPMGILTHGQGNAIEHGILVIVVNEAVIQRQHLHLLGQFGNEHDIGGLKRHRSGS